MKTEGAILVRGRLCIVDRGDSISMGETLFRYKVSGGDSVTARGRLCFGGRLYIVTPATTYNRLLPVIASCCRPVIASCCPFSPK